MNETPQTKVSAPEGYEKFIIEDKEFFRATLEGMMGLMRVKRWRRDNDSAFVSSEELKTRKETVLEHNGGMLFLAVTLAKKALAEGDTTITNLNFLEVSQKISHHDIGETYTGDSRSKTEAEKQRESEAEEQIKARIASTNIGQTIAASMDEYATKETPEDRFVKAIDELQATMYMIGTRTTENTRRSSQELTESTGYTYAQEFPTLARIMRLAVAFMKHPSLLQSNQAPEMEVIIAKE